MKRQSFYIGGAASVVFFCAALFSSCGTEKPLWREAPSNNSTYNVEYLFEHDGCKVYRFRDLGNYIYFTTCQGDVTSIENDSVRTVNKIRRQQ